MRPVFLRTTVVSVIGTALLATLAVYMLVWAIHHPSQLGDDGVNPMTGQQWKPTTFDLVLGYACFSLLALIFILFAIRELIEYLELRRQRNRRAKTDRKV